MSKLKQFFILLILFSGTITLASNPEEIVPDTSPMNDLNEVFERLDTQLGPLKIDEIKIMTEKEFIIGAHFGLGMWIRNNWIRNGQLTFLDDWRQKGALHRDDQSSIILVSYYRYLTGKAIDLEAQLKFYKSYWEKQNTTEDTVGD